MARNIRFPLKMKNGAEVRTINELKENFDLESVLGYFTDGRLQTWLADRYYDEKANAVSALSKDMPNLNAKLCEILEVEYQAEDDETDIEEIQRRKEKYQILCAITDNRDILDNIDLVAMNDDEIYKLLESRPDTIYIYIEEQGVFKCKTSQIALPDNKTAYGVGEFEIENDILIKGKADDNGICVLPCGILGISDAAFFKAEDGGDESLIKATLPDGIHSIGNQAFNLCFSLSNVSIPNSVNTIGWEAFRECDNLNNIKIPDTVSFIGNDAFFDTPWIEEQRKKNPLVIINNILIDGKGCQGDVIIPDNVTQISGGAFYKCHELSSIIIPETITSIEEFTFCDCDTLSSITIPSSVIKIGDCAFIHCTSLEKVTFLNANIEISCNAFNDTPWGKQNGYN